MIESYLLGHLKVLFQVYHKFSFQGTSRPHIVQPGVKRNVPSTTAAPGPPGAAPGSPGASPGGAGASPGRPGAAPGPLLEGC